MEWYLLFAPLVLLPIVFLVGFIGCEVAHFGPVYQFSYPLGITTGTADIPGAMHIAITFYTKFEGATIDSVSVSLGVNPEDGEQLLNNEGGDVEANSVTASLEEEDLAEAEIHCVCTIHYYAKDVMSGEETKTTNDRVLADGHGRFILVPDGDAWGVGDEPL